MQFCVPVLLGFTALATANPLVNRAACNADNCLRALKNVAVSAVASSDCSALMIETSTITVTAPASTVISKHTQVTSITVTATAVGALNKRSSIQTLPTFASACSSLSRFSSACSCIGITAATVIQTYSLPASTKIITSNVINTATVTTFTSEISSQPPISSHSPTSTTTTTQPTASLDPLPAGQFYLQVIDSATNTSLGYVNNDAITGWTVPSITGNPSATCWFDNGNVKCFCPPGSNWPGITCHDFLAFGLKDYECEHNVALGDTDYFSPPFWFTCNINTQSGFLSCTIPNNGPNATPYHFYSCGFDDDLSTRYVTYGGGSCNAGCVPVYLYANGLYNYGKYGGI